MQNFITEQSLISMGNVLGKAIVTVTIEQYEQFKKEYIFEKIKDKHFGKAFCEKFGIQDYMLSNLADENETQYLIEALGYIK